jgi:MFS transporter, FSR family, fosmidomycin resistance protein
MLAMRTTTGTATTSIGTVTVARATTGAAAVAALAASHAGVDAVTGSISALLPTLEARFELSGSGVATLLATLSASSMLAQPVVGRLADRIGARAVAAGGAVVAAGLLSLLGVVGHIALLYALLVVGGLGSAAFHPAAAAAARRVLPERASLAISIFSAGGMVGMALGPIAMLLLIAHAGAGFTPLLMIPGVALGALLWRVLPDHTPRTSHATGRARARLVRGPVGRLAGAGLFVALASTTFHAGLPLWLTERHDGNTATLGLAFIAYEIAAAAGGMLSAWAASRVCPAWLGGGSLALAPIALVGVFATTPGTAAFYLACVAAGVLLNAATPLLMVAAQERSDGAEAAASGLMGFASGAAGIVFIAIGALMDAAGLTAGLMAGFAFLAPAAFIAGRALDPRPASIPVLDVVAASGGGACACPAAA